jgi:predicted TIM-barrel fold metal-dependent hydrolase
MPTYLPFDPNPRRPSKLPPPKSIDSQFHVLGPLDKYPVRPGAAYQMPTATWEAALRVHKALGIERGIIVQTTTYGADHSVVLDALAAMGPNYRACANALVFAEADDAYLAKLHDAGVRGARFSFRQERHRENSRTRLVRKNPAGEGRHRLQRLKVRKPRRARADRPHGPP